MIKKNTVYLIGGGLLLLLVIWLVIFYNGLVVKEEKLKQQWSEVQNTYQRRLDLIPNLVNVVKGMAEFEKGTLEQIAEARSVAASGLTNPQLNGENIQRQEEMQNRLAGSVNRMLAQVERYPELKGTDAFRGLQTQLEGTERRVKIARQDFNAAVADYNQKVRGFPGNLVAGFFGFTQKEGFEAAAGAEKAVEIKF